MKVFVAIAVLFIISTSQGHGAVAPPRDAIEPLAIATGPQNLAVMLTQASVVLQCCITDSSVGGARVQWWEYGTRPGGNQITDGAQLLTAHPNYARYALSTDSTCYTLTITLLQQSDATKYMCVDFYADLPATVQRGSQLVIIHQYPLCVNQLPMGTDAEEGVYYTVECSTTFSAMYPIAPYMSWTGPPDFGVNRLTTNSSVWSGIAFFADRSMNNQSFTMTMHFTSNGFGGPDMDTSVPTWTYNLTTPTLNVRWPPQDMYIVPNLPLYEIGTTLTCYVDANPPAAYFWQAIEGPLSGATWEGQSIVLTLNMSGDNKLRCNARNVINTFERTEDQLYNVSVDFINACSPNPCQYGSSCVRQGNSYYCNCIPGTTGYNCSTIINYCESAPCQNGGSCVFSINAYQCFCEAGFTGTHCEIPNLRERKTFKPKIGAERVASNRPMRN